MQPFLSRRVVALFTIPLISFATMGGAPAIGAPPIGFVSTPGGSYFIDTDALTMTGPGFFGTGQLNGNVAVFSFDGFTLGAGASLFTQGSRPAAIHSMSDMTIGGGGITANAGGAAGGAVRQPGQGPGGGHPGFGFFGGAGGGGGYGGMGGRGQLQNPTFDFPGDGGPTYGNLELELLGGSGGGGGSNGTGSTSFATGGGAGGGAIELRALGELLISGAGVNADGQMGIGGDHVAGGGGSGGAIRIFAPMVTNTALITARGGRGGDGIFENGGGGGGGRILIETQPGGLLNLGMISVEGGAGVSDFFWLKHGRAARGTHNPRDPRARWLAPGSDCPGRNWRSAQGTII